MRAFFKHCSDNWIGLLCAWFGLCTAVFPQGVAADCTGVPDLGMLVRYSWQVSEDQALSTLYHAEMDVTLNAIDDAALRADLDSIGHSETATPIILLVQNLRTVTRLSVEGRHGSAQSYVRSEGFQAMRNRAFAAFEILCHDDKNATQMGFPTDVPTSADGSNHLSLATLKKAEQIKMEQQRQTFARVLMASWFAAVIGLILLHFSMLWLTTRRRSRHLCKIPATLEIATQTISGHVDVLGRFGNRFMPEKNQSAAQFSNIEASMHCTITIAGKVLPAKTISDALPEIGMLFSNPLEVEEVGALLAHSLTTPKRDLNAKSTTSNERLRFGSGRLPG